MNKSVNKFSKISEQRLDTCDYKLQFLMTMVLSVIDISVLCGTRGKEAQDRAFETNKSCLRYPNSKHNLTPSMAVDVAFYPIDWHDIPRWNYLCGVIKGVAYTLGIEIIQGCDWKMKDYPHTELL